jgi:hypothetical protein
MMTGRLRRLRELKQAHIDFELYPRSTALGWRAVAEIELLNDIAGGNELDSLGVNILEKHGLKLQRI